MLAAFIKDEPAKAAGLVANIQKLAETNSSLKTFVVFVGGPELKEPIEKLAADRKISIPLTFLPGGPSANDWKSWKINPEAKNTVLLYNKRQVQSNFVNVDEKSWAEVTKAAATMLAGG